MAKRVKTKFSKIIAPLEKMTTDLAKYIEEQDKDIGDFEDERAKIEGKISIAESEKAKSKNALEKIENLFK